MRAELADGRVLEFPDGTDPAVIQSTVKKMIAGGVQEQPAPQHVPQPVAQPVAQPQARPSMSEMFAKYTAGEFSPGAQGAFEELARRQFAGGTMGVSEGSPYKQPAEAGRELSVREQGMAELAADTGFLETLGVGIGKGFVNVGRGLGLAEPAGEIEQEAMSALSTESPVTTTIGETIGEAAPFLPLAVATGGISALAPRALATGAVTALEGGVISAGRDEDVLTGAGVGGAIGLGAEVLFPVLGKLGRKVFQRVTGKAPRGAMLDNLGQPTPELQEALDGAKMTFKDLQDDATEVITGAKPGSDPGQVARKAQFAEAGVPLTKGELTQDFPQQATEQRLIESAEDTAAEPLRQFKLKQSEAIKENLQSNFGFDVDQEGTGQLIQDALTGRKKLLRTQKNELYETAAENAKEIGGVPIFTDNIAEAMPDADLFEDLAITAPASMKSLDQLLTKYGMKEPTQEMVEAGFTPTPLTIENFERFRKTLGAIERGDQTGAASVAIRPIKDALDSELDEVDNIISKAFKPQKIYGDAPLPEGVAQTGKPLRYNYYHSKESAPSMGAEFAQDIEPSGKYIASVSGGDKVSKLEGFEYGVADFKNPLVLEHKTTRHGGWKTDLQNDYGGKSGEELSNAIKADGYDGIVTIDRGRISEGVMLDPSVATTKETIGEVKAPDTEKIAQVRESLKGARKTVRQLKTEFSPQSIVGKVVDVKKDGVTQVTEASKIYSKLAANASPVEETRRVVKSLLRSGEKGEQAVASLQASTMLDLIDAGFGTESRKISGVKTFNPIAFKRRLDKIGQPKLKTLFGNNKEALRKLNNIEKIATALVPPSGAQPKGSASVILDLANSLGMASIATKIPGGALLMGAMRKAAQPIKTGVTVSKAMKAEPDVLQLRNMFDQNFPGLASAIGVAGSLESQREETQ